MIILLTVGSIKKAQQNVLYKFSQYFPKPYKCSCRNVKVELDLSNYTTKNDLKGTAGVDRSNLAGKSNLAC